jgi:cholest-4-en-3-one 26-monooxygenase
MSNEAFDPSQIRLWDPAAFDDGCPHHWFRWMRHEAPVYWSEEPDGPGFWNLVRYDDVKYVSKNPKLFSSWVGGTNMFDVPDAEKEGLRSMMLNMDPPAHSKYRRIVSPHFTPRMIATLKADVERMAREIIDGVAERGECEFVEEVAAIMPMTTIFELMGVPEDDRPYVFALSNRLIGFDDPEFQSSFEDAKVAAAEMCMYGMKVQEMARICPADNLATALLHGKVDGESLSELEYTYFFLLLMIAGNETTRTMTSHGVRLLMENPAAQRMLHEDPSLVPSAVEEIVRYNPPVMHFRRTATADVEIRGQRIREGDKVLIWYPSANRDEEVFEDPDRFDILRSPNEHLSFGIGEHFCLGAHLARTQLHAIFHEIVTRLPELEPVAPPRLLRGNFVDGVKEMRVRFRPGSAAAASISTAKS